MDNFNRRDELNHLQNQFSDCLDFLQAIGDASRQRILIAIMCGEFGGSRVGDIAAKAHLSVPAVSHHLKILKNAGVVKLHSAGTKNYYYIDAKSKEFAKMKSLLLSIEMVAGECTIMHDYDEDI